MVYLDNNSTTFIDPKVVEEIEPILKKGHGNPSSIHRYGQNARQLLIKCTQKIGSFFDAKPDEILFTSGATEALNLLVRGQVDVQHVITSKLEHKSVLAPIAFLEKKGCQVTYLSPDMHGRITAQQVEKAIRPDTSMIVIMGSNNETGIINEWENIAEVANEKGIPYIMDGVALLGKTDFRLPRGVTAACFSSHKIHGPCGIGLVIIRKSLRWKSWIEGGPQQYGMRGGTENLIGIIGLTKALELTIETINPAIEKMTRLRDRLEDQLQRRLGKVVVYGAHARRVCNTSNISFPGMDGETLLMLLDQEGIAVSHGAACSSGALEPSHVLLGMGIDPKLIRGSLRFSLSRYTTDEEIEKTVSALCKIVQQKVRP